MLSSSKLVSHPKFGQIIVSRGGVSVTNDRLEEKK